jgi:hypothetical protein
MNHNAVNHKAFNILEIKLTTYLISKGSITFTYKRKSKQELGYINGLLKFFLNSNPMPVSNSPFMTEPETFSFEVPKGPNEFTWRFTLNTAADFSTLSFEFIV